MHKSAKGIPMVWARLARAGAAIAAVLAWLVPSPVSAETPVGTAVLYEVNEALRLIKPRKPVSTADLSLRLAKASLLGKEVRALTDDSPFALGSFVQAEATSGVNLNTGKGPIAGSLLLLNDIDPTRESIDTLKVSVAGNVSGTLDLSTATQGFARMNGQWRFRTLKRTGTFDGVFLIPFEVDGHYFYVNLGPDGPGTACDSFDSLCPLVDDEFSLGIPLTKLLVTFLE